LNYSAYAIFAANFLKLFSGNNSLVYNVRLEYLDFFLKIINVEQELNLFNLPVKEPNIDFVIFYYLDYTNFIINAKTNSKIDYSVSE
jgi:hypothetical protein